MASQEPTLKSSDNLDLFTEAFILKHGSQSEHIHKILTSRSYRFKPQPSHTDVYTLAGIPADTLIYGEKDITTGVISLKLDATTIKRFQEDIDIHLAKVHHNRMTEGAVLNDLTSRISDVSKALIKYASGDHYEEDRFSLSKVWWLLMDSHAKGNTTAMLEAIVNMSNLSMGSDDFYTYTDKAAVTYKTFSKVFADHWDKPMKHFSDLFMLLSVIGGLNKGDEVFANVIREVRLMDLTKFSDSPLYPRILTMLVSANHSRSLLISKSQHVGMSTTVEANSSMNLTLVAKCAKCKEATIPHEVDSNGVLVKKYCKDCFKDMRTKRYTERIAKEAKEKAKAKAALSQEKPIPPIKLKQVVSTTPQSPPPKAPKAPKAAAATFSGTTNLANSSTSKHYLLTQGTHPESEYEEEVSESD